MTSLASERGARPEPVRLTTVVMGLIEPFMKTDPYLASEISASMNQSRLRTAPTVEGIIAFALKVQVELQNKHLFDQQQTTPNMGRHPQANSTKVPETTEEEEIAAMKGKKGTKGKGKGKKGKKGKKGNKGKPKAEGKSGYSPPLVCPDYRKPSGCPKGGTCPLSHPDKTGCCRNCGSEDHWRDGCKRPMKTRAAQSEYEQAGDDQNYSWDDQSWWDDSYFGKKTVGMNPILQSTTIVLGKSGTLHLQVRPRGLQKLGLQNKLQLRRQVNGM